MTTPSTPDTPLDAHRSFNPYRRFQTDKFALLLEAVIEAVDRHEGHHGERLQRRRKDAQRTLEESVEALLADLFHLQLTASPNAQLALYLTKCTTAYPKRYRAKFETAVFRGAVLTLARTGWLSILKGRDKRFAHISKPPYDSTRTRIWPGKKLVDWLAANETPTLQDLRTVPGGETVILKRAKANHWDDGGKLDYDDTPQTIEFRQEIDALNIWFASLDIAYAGQAADASERFVRRYFNLGSFDKGGRLFGGFWMNLPKPERANLKLGGESVATLDYSQTFPRLLYAISGASPVRTDLYAIEGLAPNTATA